MFRFVFATLLVLFALDQSSLAQALSDNIQTGSIAPLDESPISKTIVVLDPGHGGLDPGASSSHGLLEKDIVLEFAEVLKLSLEMTGKFQVLLTRFDDTFVGLEQRAEIARNAKASLLIAIHADSLKEDHVRGMTIYGHADQASDAKAAALAQKENRVDKIGGLKLSGEKPEVADVLVALAKRESRFEAGRFAKFALRDLKKITPLAHNPLRAANFIVLKAPDVPSVLIELGYLSNVEDVKLLGSSKWRADVADAMTRALVGQFGGVLTAGK